MLFVPHGDDHALPHSIPYPFGGLPLPENVQRTWVIFGPRLFPLTPYRDYALGTAITPGTP